MAWKMVDYRCGHSIREQFYGPGKDRESRKEWKERGVCPDCYRVQKTQELAIESKVAAEQAVAQGLPMLAGSEKQIAWAETIRKNALVGPSNVIMSDMSAEAIIAARPADQVEHFKEVRRIQVEARKRLETETSAKWWIENRETVGRYVWETMRQQTLRLMRPAHSARRRK